MITISKLMEYAADVKVLYVEDDKDIQEEIRDFLSRFFPTIDLADNGQEGLNLYKNGNYDIVISDINMPKMNGIEMVRAIKEINEEQKVIITSAYNEPQYLMELIDSGVDKFVLKPFNNKKFLLVLYKISESIFNEKQNNLLQEKILQQTAETQIIVNMMEHGIVVIDDAEVTQVNQQFLEMAGYSNQEDFYQEIKNLSSLFESHKGYIDVNSNDELIQTLESKKNELYKVVMKIDLMDKIYLLKYKKVPNENKYVISFTDITEEEGLVNVNTKTGLPNVFAVTAEIEYRINSNLPFVVDLVRIENVEKMVKWHGRQVRNVVDENVAEVFKANKEDLDNRGVFVSYYGHNKFLLVRGEQTHDLVTRVVNKIALISAKEEGEEEASNKNDIPYKPTTTSIEVQPNAEVDNVVELVNETFENLLF